MNAVQKKTSSLGFTLVELMIVVVIVGILATIAIPSFVHAIERAKCAQAIDVLRLMRTAALSYFSDQQTFLGITLQGLENQVGANFFSAGNNPNWTYSVPVCTATALQVQAARLGGPHLGTPNIIITDNVTTNQKEFWGNSTYPYDDPGNF